MSRGDARIPWLTVATVVKDAPTAFAETMASLAQQDLDGVELVVVDGSADPDPIRAAMSSHAVIEQRYASAQPRGIYPAMNDALRLASGRHTYFLNAGDVFHGPDVLRQVADVVRWDDPPWAFGAVEIVGLDGSRVVTPRWDYAKEKSAGFSRGHFPPHQGTFVRTALLRDQGGFDPRFSIVADYASFLKLSRISDPRDLDLVVARFTEGGASTTGWLESVWQFHQARREILAPTGVAALREYGDTVKQALAMGLYRKVFSRIRPA